jgi:ATP/maltotriose-dependent transcriptional regulator MalT
MLNVFLGRIGEFEQALSIARQSALAAKATADEGAMAVSEWMLGTAHHLIGDQGAAQAHCDAGCAHDAAARGRRHDIFGYDHRVRALVVRSRTLWLRGFPEQAGRVAREAIDAAEGLNQPVTACLSLIYTAPVFLWSGDLSSAERAVSQLLEQARQHSLKPFQTVGRGLLGKLLVDRGQRDAGIELLLDAVEALDEEQHLIQVPEFRTYIAEALRDESGRALASIDRAIVERARSGSSFDMPEILRVKGLILLGASDAKRTVGFAQLARSLELAQVQGSLSWALRTATSIVQMDAGNRAARRTLAQIYGRFTEGFDGPDLQAAQRLLRPSRRGRTVP